MCPLTYLPFPLTGILFPRLNWLPSGGFLIVGLVFGAKICRGYSSPREFFRMLLVVFIGFGMSKRCFVKHRGVCCLMLP